jgi:hypothetical protein
VQAGDFKNLEIKLHADPRTKPLKTELQKSCLPVGKRKKKLSVQNHESFGLWALTLATSLRP